MGIIGDIVSSVTQFFDTFISTVPSFVRFMIFLMLLINLIVPITNFFLGSQYSCTTEGELYGASFDSVQDIYLTTEEISNVSIECELSGYDIPNYEVGDDPRALVYVTGKNSVIKNTNQNIFSFLNVFFYKKNRDIVCNNLIAMGGEEQDLDWILKNYGKKIIIDETYAVGLTCSSTDVNERPHVTIGFFGFDILDAWMWNALIVFIIFVPFAFSWYSQLK